VVEGVLKTAAFGILRATGILALSEQRARGVAILAYHGVTANDSQGSALRNRRRLHVTAERFEEHLRMLRKRWAVIPLSEVQAILAKGGPMPRRAVVVTFDDGYRNFLTNALPVLERHSVPATLFVLTAVPRRLWVDRVEAAFQATRKPRLEWTGLDLDLATEQKRIASLDRVIRHLSALDGDRDAAVVSLMQELDADADAPDDDRDLLSWDEIRTLAKAGIEIGCHADRHEALPRRHQMNLANELARARLRLVEELGDRAFPFSYPYGAWTPPIRAAVIAAGFTSAVTTDAVLNGDSADPFLLGRFLVGADDDVVRLRASAAGLRAHLAALGSG
jgi:peptidoglycan/xylan/chitin deacetylase (PgdA/CDA1 family)